MGVGSEKCRPGKNLSETWECFSLGEIPSSSILNSMREWVRTVNTAGPPLRREISSLHQREAIAAKGS